MQDFRYVGLDILTQETSIRRYSSLFYRGKIAKIHVITTEGMGWSLRFYPTGVRGGVYMFGFMNK